MSEIGRPGQQQDAEQVVGEALDPHLDQPGRPDREVARQGRRVVPGEDVEAGHRRTRWRRPGPGSGLPKTSQSRIAHGSEDERARRRRDRR